MARVGRRRKLRGLALTDLSRLARIYVIGVCGNDQALADGVMRLLFQESSERAIAKELRLPRETLRRKAGRVRDGLDGMISAGTLSVVDLIAKE